MPFGWSRISWRPPGSHGARHASAVNGLFQIQRRKTSLALVHGDVSPKNILVGPGRARSSSTRNAPGIGDPGVRPRVLPQPPAAEVPLGARRSHRRVPRECVRCAVVEAYLARRRTGSRPPLLEAARRQRCCPACCSRAWTASRRWNISTLRFSRRDLVRAFAKRVSRSAPLLANHGRQVRQRMAKILDVLARKVWDSRGPRHRGSGRSR